MFECVLVTNSTTEPSEDTSEEAGTLKKKIRKYYLAYPFSRWSSMLRVDS